MIGNQKRRTKTSITPITACVLTTLRIFFNLFIFVWIFLAYNQQSRQNKPTADVLRLRMLLLMRQIQAFVKQEKNKRAAAYQINRILNLLHDAVVSHRQ